MPHVKRKQIASLNRSYGYVVSGVLMETLQSLKDGLVQNGFERQYADELISSLAPAVPIEDLFTPKSDITVELPVKDENLVLPSEHLMAALPKAVRDKVELCPESGTLTIKAGATADQVLRVAKAFPKEFVSEMRDKLAVAQAKQAVPDRKPTPSDRGETWSVPLLMLRQGTYFDVFDETMLLHDDNLTITSFNWKLTESEFPRSAEIMARGLISVREKGSTLYSQMLDQLEFDLDLMGEERGWTIDTLVQWLDQNIDFQYADRDQKTAWFFKALNYLMEEREFTLSELARSKFRLKRTLEDKLAVGLDNAKQLTLDQILGNDSGFEVSSEKQVVFESGRYPCNSVYSGGHIFEKHFFPQVGELSERGEEFECACEIDSMPEVKWWVRNLTNKKDHAFWLQTSKDKFYPDFVVGLKNGVSLVVEYKGKDRITADDAREKDVIGKVWAKRSDGKGRFIMFGGKEWEKLRAVAMTSG